MRIIYSLRKVWWEPSLNLILLPFCYKLTNEHKKPRSQ